MVACNSATAAALPALQAHVAERTLPIDVVGVVGPESVLAVAATRNGRVGLLATPATVASRAYDRAIQSADPLVRLESVPCPDLAPIVQSGFPFDQRVVDTVRTYCAPLREAGVDTVILGCTHYPLVAPMLQRALGRGVTLIPSGAAVARRVEHALAGRGLENPRETRATTASCARATWSRSARSAPGSCSCRMGDIEHVDVGTKVAV